VRLQGRADVGLAAVINQTLKASAYVWWSAPARSLVQHRTALGIEPRAAARQVWAIEDEVHTNGGSNRPSDFCRSNRFAYVSLVDLPPQWRVSSDIANGRACKPLDGRRKRKKAGRSDDGAIMADRRSIQVACPDCGMRAEVRLEPSGLQNNITDTVSKCKRNRRGPDVVGCRGLRPELLRAAAALRGNEHQ
jgi:hypothetical protein